MRLMMKRYHSCERIVVLSSSGSSNSASPIKLAIAVPQLIYISLE